MINKTQETQWFRESHELHGRPLKGNNKRQYQMEAEVELVFPNGTVATQYGTSFIRARGDGILTKEDYHALERECIRSAKANYGRTEEEKKEKPSGMVVASKLPLLKSTKIIWSRIIIFRQMKVKYRKENGKVVKGHDGKPIRDSDYKPKRLQFKAPATTMQRYNGKHYVQIDSPKGKLWREMETGIVYSNGTYTKRIKKGLSAKPYHARS